MKKLLFLIFISAIVLTGCDQQPGKTADSMVDAAIGVNLIEKNIQANKDLAKAQCIEICRQAQREFMVLNIGPCLGNPIANMAEWVCDVAHSPRQDVDNKIENQCSSFAEGSAKHFVEVDPDCNFIKNY
ncbi:MAG: hypothetical protein US74_C0022G0004 [Parcubacteria group bacterium GW2011_GWA2_38_13]|nr:MAG: hypothetical protein US74_C0022G0004 [Parcubacteria group bacterium GW2011_GWA2_38_13]